MHFHLSRLLLIILVLASLSVLLPSVQASSKEILRPNAVGDSSQNTPTGATPGWNCVEEAVSDADTTYIGSITGDNEGVVRLDLYNIDATAIPAGSTINSINVTIVARSEHPTWKAYFRTAAKKSGSSASYGAINGPSTSYTTYNTVFGNVALGDLDLLQIGVEITSGYNPRLETCTPGRVTQIYVTIDYTLVTASWNNVSTWSSFLVTRAWQSSGTWSDFLLSRMWQNSGVWSDSLISRSWQNIEVWNVNLLTIGWKTIATWSILLLGEDATSIVVILFLFSVVAFTFFGLYRRKKKDG